MDYRVKILVSLLSITEISRDYDTFTWIAWIATALQIKMPVSGTNPQILNGPSDTWDKNVKKAI